MSDTLEQRIAQLEAELAAQRSEMQDFTYTVSHDLRASLRHIISYAHLVQEDAGPQLSAEVQRFLATITDSAQHMGLLMDGLMELSRLGTVMLSVGPTHLEDTVAEVRDALTAHYRHRALDWHVDQHLPWVLADASLLTLALRQVLDNAIKFTTHRPLAVLEVAAQRDQGWVHLDIRDNGAGFNPAMQERLFHPFQRLHTARQFPGIGMGLALTRKIVQRLGGSVSAQAQVEQGCCVRLSLPMATPPQICSASS
jgi:signal transduction histidine kinase